jgi:hypothetical protein
MLCLADEGGPWEESSGDCGEYFDVRRILRIAAVIRQRMSVPSSLPLRDCEGRKEGRDARLQTNAQKADSSF